MTAAWQQYPGHQAARILITQYPTPRALRQALTNEGTDIIPAEVRRLAWNRQATIGEVLTSAAWSPRHIVTLHSILTQYAQDYTVWTASDGSTTIRS